MTTIRATVRVTLPDAAENSGPVLLKPSTPPRRKATRGGLDTVGWSASVSDLDGGSSGFQRPTSSGESTASCSNTVSWRDGTNRNIFSFGSGALGATDFVAGAEAALAPAEVAALATLDLAAGRRRRR